MIYGKVFIDYLRLIYQYNQNKIKIRNIEISKSLEVSKPTVTNKVKEMIQKGYVKNRNGELFLTEDGLRLCNQINDVIIQFEVKLRPLFTSVNITSWALAILGNQDFEQIFAVFFPNI